MKTFKVCTDEHIRVWQRVELNIEADTEQALNAMLADPALFKQAMKQGRVHFTGNLQQPWWETEETLNWDHENVQIVELTEETE